MKCKYCDAKATMGLIWADGRAIVPVCGDEHLAKARRDVGEPGRVRKFSEETDVVELKVQDIKLSSGWLREVRAKTLGEYAYYRGRGVTKYNVAHVPTGATLRVDLIERIAEALVRWLHANVPHPFPGVGFGENPDRRKVERLFEMIKRGEAEVKRVDQKRKQKAVRIASNDVVGRRKVKIAKADKSVAQVVATVLGEYAYYRDKYNYVVMHVPTGFLLVADISSKSEALELIQRLHKKLPHPFPGVGFREVPADRAQIDKLRKLTFYNEARIPDYDDISAYTSGWGLRARWRVRSVLDELRTPAGKHIAGTKPDRMPKEFLKALGTDWSVFRARRVGENRLSVRIDGKKFTIYSREG